MLENHVTLSFLLLQEKYVREKISTLDPRIVKKVIVNFLDTREKKVKTISADLGTKVSDVDITLRELMLQGLIAERKHNYENLLESLLILSEILWKKEQNS